MPDFDDNHWQNVNSAITEAGQSGDCFAVYNGKKVSMAYISDKKRQFKMAGMRIIDNGYDGHVVTPKGEIFEVGKSNRRATRVSGKSMKPRHKHVCQDCATNGETAACECSRKPDGEEKAYGPYNDHYLGDEGGPKRRFYSKQDADRWITNVAEEHGVYELESTHSKIPGFAPEWVVILPNSARHLMQAHEGNTIRRKKGMHRKTKSFPSPYEAGLSAGKASYSPTQIDPPSSEVRKQAAERAGFKGDEVQQYRQGYMAGWQQAWRENKGKSLPRQHTKDILDFDEWVKVVEEMIEDAVTGIESVGRWGANQINKLRQLFSRGVTPEQAAIQLQHEGKSMKRKTKGVGSRAYNLAVQDVPWHYSRHGGDNDSDIALPGALESLLETGKISEDEVEDYEQGFRDAWEKAAEKWALKIRGITGKRKSLPVKTKSADVDFLPRIKNLFIGEQKKKALECEAEDIRDMRRQLSDLMFNIETLSCRSVDAKTRLIAERVHELLKQGVDLLFDANNHG